MPIINLVDGRLIDGTWMCSWVDEEFVTVSIGLCSFSLHKDVFHDFRIC